MNEVKKFDIKTLVSKATDLLRTMQNYSMPVFLVFVGIVYGFIFFQINSLSSTEPTSEAVTNQIQASQTPHIDKAVIKQLESLQDNSVNVQTLFNNARSNPFQ